VKGASAGQAVKGFNGTWKIAVGRATRVRTWVRVLMPWHGTWQYWIFWRTRHQRESAFKADKTQTKKWMWIPIDEHTLDAGGDSLTLNWPGGAWLDLVALAPKDMGAKTIEARFKASRRRKGFASGAPAERGWVATSLLRPPGLVGWISAKVESRGDVKLSCRTEADASWRPVERLGSLVGVTGPVALRAELRRDGRSPVVKGFVLTYRRSKNAVIVLGDAKMKLSFDAQTGNLVALQPSGRDAIEPNQTGLFQLAVRKPKAKTLDWLDRKDFTCKSVRSSGKTLSARYDALDGGLLVALDVKMTAPGRSRWRLEIQNRSALEVRRVRFPVIGPLELGLDGSDDTLLMPHELGERYMPASGVPTYLQVLRPGSMSWMDLADGRDGLYFGVHDKAFIDFENEAVPTRGRDAVTLSFVKEAFVPPGGAWKSADCVVASHGPDWHRGAEIYRAWYDAECRKPDVPDWLRYDYDGSFVMGLADSGRPAWGFSDLAAVYREGLWIGCNFLKISGQGADVSSNPFYPYPNPAQGGPWTLKRVAGEITRAGGQMNAYLDCRLWSRQYAADAMVGATPRCALPPDARIEPLEWVDRNRLVPLEHIDGLPPGSSASGSNTLRMVTMCPAADEWREHCAWWIEYYAKMGLNVYFDETARAHQRICYADHHGHKGNGYWTPGLMKILEEAIPRARKAKSDFALAVEGERDSIMQFAHMTLLIRATNFPSMYVWTHPRVIHHIIAGRMENRSLLKFVALYGARLSTMRPTGLFRRSYALRRKVKDVLYRARFMDDVGLKSAKADARWWLLDEEGRSLALVGIAREPGEVDSAGSVELASGAFAKCARAFAYTFDGRVRPVKLRSRSGRIAFAAPPSEFSYVLLVGRETPARAVRVGAFQPMRPGPDVLTVTLANAGSSKVDVKLRFELPANVSLANAPGKIELAAGECRNLELPLAGLKDLKRIEPLDVVAGEARSRVYVAPPIPNASFELDENGDFLADGWGAPRDWLAPADGKYCLRLSSLYRQNRHRHMAKRRVFLKPGTRYRISCRFRRDSSVGRVLLSLFLRNDDYKVIQAVHIGPMSDASRRNEWRVFEKTFTTDGRIGGTPGRLYLVNSDSDGPAWFDDLKLVELGPATGGKK